MSWAEEELVNDLSIYRISEFHCSSLTRNELGVLIADFNKRFHFWNLLFRTHVAERSKGTYVLYIVRGFSFPDKDDQKLLKSDMEKMQSFIRGYITAVRSFVGERNKYKW